MTIRELRNKLTHAMVNYADNNHHHYCDLVDFDKFTSTAHKVFAEIASHHEAKFVVPFNFGSEPYIAFVYLPDFWFEENSDSPCIECSVDTKNISFSQTEKYVMSALYDRYLQKETTLKAFLPAQCFGYLLTNQPVHTWDVPEEEVATYAQYLEDHYCEQLATEVTDTYDSLLRIAIFPRATKWGPDAYKKLTSADLANALKLEQFAATYDPYMPYNGIVQAAIQRVLLETHLNLSASEYTTDVIFAYLKPKEFDWSVGFPRSIAKAPFANRIHMPTAFMTALYILDQAEGWYEF